MSNIDKQELREEFQYMQEHYSDPADRERQLIYIAAEALLDELEAAEELVVLQRFKLERQAEDLHQAKSLESIHRDKRFEVEREFRDYKDRADSNHMRLAKEVCRLEDELQAAGIGKGE